MYVRHGDNATFKWYDMGIFDTRSVWVFFWFWQQQPKSSCRQQIPTSLALWMSCMKNPLAICALINCCSQTLFLSVVDYSLKVTSYREEQACLRHPVDKNGLNPGRSFSTMCLDH